jgi:hypothetical protein
MQHQTQTESNEILVDKDDTDKVEKTKEEN